jgi:hypothetical protein
MSTAVPAYGLNRPGWPNLAAAECPSKSAAARANLFAQVPGVLVVDKDAINRLNRVDDAIGTGRSRPLANPKPATMISS